MQTSSHLTDETLNQILDDEHFDTRETAIETHLDSCEHCRTRLEQLASEENWLEPFRASLSNRDVLRHLERPAQKPPPTTNSYDLAAIKTMLGELLGPSLHPETLGQLGKYEVEEVIGCGGMGVVLKAYDRELQRPVAIKLVVPRLAHDGTAKQRFAREARAAATVLHPNVIAIHCIDETEGVPWFVMPFVNGPSLEDLVLNQGPLPENEIVRVGLQLASGLAAAHSHGVTHRDIKPANVLVDNFVNRVVITDFGLARQQSDTMITQPGVLAGTLQYMSPEQTRGEELDNQSDLFSLGGLLYFLATGRPPFDSETPVGILHKITNKPHQDVRVLNPSISATLASAIDTLLAKDSKERFRSASELESFFSQLVSHQNQPTQHQLPAVPKPVRPFRVRLGIASLAFATLLVLLSAVGLSYRNQPTSAHATRAATWAAIQSKYDLEPNEVFSQELYQLSHEVELVVSGLSTPAERVDDPALNSDLSQIESSLQRVQQAMDEF